MADEITRWNAVLLNVIQDVGGPPGPIARGAAMMHAAMYDAVNSIAPATHKPYCVSVPLTTMGRVAIEVGFGERERLADPQPCATTTQVHPRSRFRKSG